MNDKEIIRHEKYCQLRKEIRGSEDHMIVGIDVAKDKHYAFFGTATGKTLLKRLIFENNIDGYSRLFARTEAIRVQNCLSEIVFGLEPTGNYHKPLATHLIRCDHNVVLVSGVAVKRNRELLDGRWDKHDTKCAANIADLISQGKCLFYESPLPDINELLSLRKRLKKEDHSLRMRIRNNLLAKYFPELDRFYGQCETENLAIVRWCLEPGKIAGMEFNKFFQIVTTRERGIAQKQRLRKIHSLSSESVGCPMGQASEFEAQVLVDKLKQVRQVIKKTEDLVRDVSLGSPEYNWMLTIPGFGPYVSSIVLATIGDPFRFNNRKQVLKMSGYDLNANRSGKTSLSAVPLSLVVTI